MGYEIEVRATVVGVVAGFSVGGSHGSSLLVTSASETSYTGSVGTIDAANFFANQYAFGLFTYVHSDARTGQQFEVVDYWIE